MPLPAGPSPTPGREERPPRPVAQEAGVGRPQHVLRELQEKEAMLAAARRLAKLRGWSYDVAAGLLNWASDTNGIFSLSEQELANLTLPAFFEYVHPDDRPRLENLAQRVLFSGLRSFTFRYRFLAKSGEEKSIAGDGEAQVDANGKVCRVIGTVMDVTEHERTRQAELVGEARIRALAESSTVWLWEQDQELRFTMLTDTRDENLNRIHAAAIGKRRWEMPHCTPCRGNWDEHREGLQARRPFQDFEYRVGLGPAARVFSTTGVPVYDATGQFAGYRGTAYDITQLKAAQASSEQAEALLRLASRLGRVGAWAIDLPERKASWSSEFQNIYEFGQDAQLTVKKIMSLVHPEWQAATDRAFKACWSAGAPVDLELRSFTAKGNNVWLRLTAEAVRDERGVIRRIQGAAQDITERKEAAERLRLLSEELTKTFESITDAFVTVDRDLRITYANPEAERGTGLRRKELTGKLMSELFPTFAGSDFQKELEAALAGGTTRRFEVYAKALGKWLNVTAYSSAQGLALYIHDITRARSAREALIDSEERYRLLFQTSADGIVKAAPDGRIHRTNPAACAMFGRTEEEMCTLLSQQLVSPADERLKGLVQERLRRGGARGELTMIRADGSLFEAEVNTSTYRNREGAVFVNIVVRDATERIQWRQKLMALNEELADRVQQRTVELERANAELKGFARSLAHDLRQPIGAIKAFSFALDNALTKSEPDKARQYGGQIGAAAQLMGEYVEALLSLARVSQATLHKEQVDLSAIASSLLDELHDLDRTRRLTREVQPGLRAWGDATLLRLLLQNLVGNAWKFTSRCEVAQISVTAESGPDGEVVYCVRDNGAGFDMAQAERLFGNFQRLHSDADFPGMGIGLANAQRIVLRHGGRIWATSRVGEGATFRFTLGSRQPDY